MIIKLAIYCKPFICPFPDIDILAYKLHSMNYSQLKHNIANPFFPSGHKGCIKKHRSEDSLGSFLTYQGDFLTPFYYFLLKLNT